MIKLIVKAANGSVEDFRVDAEKDWTIYQLKNHIYRYYPSHPPIPVQKLIYGGKLLLNQMSLDEVLPSMSSASGSPSSDDSFVIHLVAYQRSNSAPTSSMIETSQKRVHARAPPPPSHGAAAEGEEGVGGRGERRDTPVSPPAEERVDGGYRPQQPQHNMSPLTNPWLRHRGMGVANPPMGVANPPGLQNFPMFGPGVGPMGGYPFAPPPQFYQSPYGAAYLQQWYNYYRVPPGSVRGEGTRDNVNPPDLPPRPDEPDNDLPEPEEQFAAPVNNAPGGLGMMAAAPGMRHRDLVDYIYMLMMVGFLVLIAFLTGSLGRLIIFAAGVMFMLLNQGGFFSLQRRRPPAPAPAPALPAAAPVPVVNNPGDADQRPAEQNEVPAAPGAVGTTGGGNHQGPRQEGGANPGNQDVVDSPPVPSPPPPPPPREERPGIMATAFVFLTSFFSSLVPQQRPDLQVN